jgi:HEAT repeat protein
MIKTLMLIVIILSVLPFANAQDIRNDMGLNYYISYLYDENNLTRMQAVTHIADSRDEKGLLPLIEVMRSDGDWRIRAAAAKSLGSFTSSGQVEPLIQALNYDPNSYVRSDAANALGTLNDTRAIGPLSLSLEDKDPMVRSSAAYALGRLGRVTAIDSLNKALNDEDLTVHVAAQWSLDKLNYSAI